MLGFIGDDRGPDPLPRQRIIAFHMCWAVMVPTFCYMFLADAPMVFILALPLVVVSLAKRRSYRLSNRAKVYSFVIPLVFASLFDLVYKVDMNHFFMSVSTLCPLLIFYGLSVSLLDQRPETLVTGMACGLGVMLIQGLTLAPPDFKRIALPHPFFMDRFKLFILAVLAQSYSILHLPKLAVSLHRDLRTESVGRQLMRAGLTVGSTILVFAVSLGFCFGTVKAFRFLDPFFSSSYRNFLQRRSNKTLFKDRISTDATLAWKLDKYGEKPALFVTGETAPGYLRGRAYTRYDGGEWTAERRREDLWVPDAPSPLPLETGRGGLSINTWLREAADEEERRTADVYLANRFRPSELYLPGNVDGVSLIADRLSNSTDGIFVANGWDETTGYRYVVPSVDQSAAYPFPLIPNDDYLHVSEEILPIAHMHAAEAIVGSTTVPEKIRAVAAYLSNNFSYSLAPKKPCPKDTDPVVHFLRASREGHCELFASAAVAMLRTQGIKCRYVTGFVCFETLPGGVHVARFKHCHAWAEAWVPDTGWGTVEATPASGVPQSSQTAMTTALSESIQNWFVHMLSAVKRGYFAKAIIDGFFAVMRALNATFLSVYGFLAWPILLLAIKFGVDHYRRRQRPTSLHPNATLFLDIRRALIALLRKRGVTYEGHMSLRDVIEATPYDDEFEALIREYERLRYDPSTMETEVQDFSKRFTQWVRKPEASTH